jgi:predicted ATPase
VGSFGPLVVVLDDLQLADVASLDFIQSMLDDKDNPGLMVICTYRTEEVDGKHPLLETIRRIEENGAGITAIDVENLSIEHLNSMFRDILNLHGDTAYGLASCVHRKTMGNAFFAIQLLKSLSERGLLTYNLGSFSWTWDIKSIEQAVVATENVVDLLKSNLEKLPEDLCELIPVIASLGSTFSSTTASYAIDYFHDKVKHTGKEERDIPQKIQQNKPYDTKGAEIIDVCLKEGFIEEQSESRYRWVHDKIQEAALALVKSANLFNMQYQLGELLLEKWSETEIRANVFTIVDLIGKNRRRLPDEGRETKIRMARLCLMAGDKAIRTSSFSQAAKYLDRGIDLLPNDHWKEHYNLSLRLFSGAAEAHYCLGVLGKTESYCNEIVSQKEGPLLDKRRAYNVLISSIAAQGRNVDAQDKCLEVLAKLGIRFPKIGQTFSVLIGILRAKLSLKRTTKQLANLTRMTDESKIWVMVLLDKLVGYAYQDSGSALVPLATFKGLQLTVKHGISEYTPPILAIVGLLLVVALKDYKGAKDYAEKALALLKEPNCRQSESRTHFIVYEFIMHWVSPIEVSITGFLDGYYMGIATGDTENASWNKYMYLEKMIITGRGSLGDIIDDFENDVDQMVKWNQLKPSSFTRILWQVVLNLMGRSENTVILTGKAMDQEKLLQESLKTKNDNTRFVMSFCRLYVALIFDQYEIAMEQLEEWNMHKGYLQKAMPGTFLITHLYFHCALTCISMARKTKRRKYRKMARSFARVIEEWVDKGNPNVRRYGELLKAEFASLDGKGPRAEHHYETAILLCGRRGMRNVWALAHQRRGEFHLREGNDDDALHDINYSIRLYEDWGAKAKAEQLKEKYKELLAPPSEIETTFFSTIP